MALILSVGTPSASVRVPRLPFLMGFGSTFQTMMPLPSLSSLLRGTAGIDVTFLAFLILYRSLLANLMFLFIDDEIRYVDAVMTIPKGTLFPMCGMNLAFDRDLIGPAMYFGLMGDGQPIGRYDDMWAGWCTKVCSFSPFRNNLCIVQANYCSPLTNHNPC